MPIASYDDLRPAIERMAAGEPEVLVSERVIAFEETGGSTGGAKLIPCGEESLAAFRRALLPWLDDLAAAHPAITRGRAYWAISPAARAPRRTPGGMPIGLGSDAAYFGADLAPLLAEMLASPPELASVCDVGAWREATCRALLECRDLTLISVWSPSFLALLLDRLGDRDLSALWPRLTVVSCWDQGSSRREAAALRDRLPGVHLQGKGLLATEGVMTIPLQGLAQPVLAVDSAYYEFQDDAGHCRGACEVEEGAEYQIVLSTESGFYRYAIGDRVKVHGFAGTAPLLEFLGRGAQVSDLCGEKLSEPFVVSALQPLGVRFAVVAPAGAQDRYLLYLDAAEASVERAAALAARAEAALCRNPQYAYARQLGQLAALEPRRCTRPLDSWLGAGMARGQRLGDIKPPALAPAGWLR